jgi:uncharacterized protein YecE (DUF72 family)
MAQIRIGTSGWNYRHWIGTFYPEEIKSAGQFGYYMRFFETVELNNSFYHLPKREVFEGWKKKTPKDFLFAVKGSRFITHMKKLNDVAESVNYFLSNASGLGRKLGPILFQLPPNWQINTDRLAQFLEVLPGRYRYTIEFRNETWYDDSVYELLEKHNCAFCIYHLAGHTSPLKVTADFVYVRLHGPGDKYQGNYASRDLKKWADRCGKWMSEGRDVFVYFDNDQLGYAPKNALDLLRLVRRTRK